MAGGKLRSGQLRELVAVFEDGREQLAQLGSVTVRVDRNDGVADEAFTVDWHVPTGVIAHLTVLGTGHVWYAVRQASRQKLFRQLMGVGPLALVATASEVFETFRACGAEMMELSDEYTTDADQRVFNRVRQRWLRLSKPTRH